MKLVGVFAATRWECDAVRRAVVVERRMHVGGTRCLVGRRGNSRLFLWRTGVGPVRSGTVSREALAGQPLDLAVSAGFACALAPSQVGELLIGSEVVSLGAAGASSDQAVPCAAPYRAAAVDAARAAGVAARAGRFVTTPRVVWRAEEKRRVAAETGAVGLDMESAAIGAVAAARGVPFLVVRAASDLVDEDLPLDFNLFLSPAGWTSGIVQCLLQPSSLGGLARLRRQTELAAERTVRFWGAFLDAQ
ncbi:MAG: hypothetical protein AB1411_12690 [Nitrospirota bacterium]